MATEDIYPQLTEIGNVFPATYRVDYVREIGLTTKMPDLQVYTIAQIYGMVRDDLIGLGVSPELVTFQWFLFHFRHILNDYSAKVEEFQFAVQFTGGGGTFKIPSMNRIIKLDVNGYGATAASEKGMTAYRAAGETLRTNEFIYSVNGNLLNIYPAIGDADTVTILASVFAEDFDDDSADAIVPQADGFILYEGVRWKCREARGKDYLEAKISYIQALNERKSRIERQLYPSQLRSPSIL